MRLHLRFKNFRPTTVAAAEALFAARPWLFEDDAERVAVGQTFVDAVAASYNIPTAVVGLRRNFSDAVRYQPALVEENALGELTSLSPPRIFLDHWSILSLFNGVRVHLLANGETPTSEIDPHAWACSLFYAVRPAMFRARVREGRVLQMAAKDTYKSDTWQQLVVAGVASDDSGRLIVDRRDVQRVLNGEVTVGDLLTAEVEDDDEDEDDIDGMIEDAAEFLGSVGEPEEEETETYDENDEEVSETAHDDMLTGVNRDTLRQMAKDRNIPGRGRMSADELRQAVRDHDADRHED